ncbi:MAG: ABC transporter permease [Deltaproteobacteria bacterium]|nr:ABC transporter permease [Deltaproteobacteria bacterium]
MNSLKLIFRLIKSVQEFSLLAYHGLRGIFQRPIYWRDTIDQMDRFGIGSFLIVGFTGLFTGMVMALQMAVTLERFGIKSLVGRAVSVSIVRELGPVLSALIVAGRMGSGIAAEIGAMKVGEQTDALRAMGTDPVRKLVTPRMIAGLIMMPVLTVFADFIGVFGSYVICSSVLDFSGNLYWTSVLESLDETDVFPGLTKPLFFGLIISTVGCYMGLGTRGGTVGVGKAATESVVIASLGIILADFLITKFYFAIL